MYVYEPELAVLKAIADRVCSVEQVTPQRVVIGDLRSGTKFCGIEGANLFHGAVANLVANGLVEQRLHNGETHLKLTTDALKVDGLDIECMV